MRLVILGILILAGLLWKSLRPLRHFIVVLFVMCAASEIPARLDFNFEFMQNILGDHSFVSEMQSEKFGKLAVSLSMILVLAILGYSRARMYQIAGNLAALITPAKWLGFPISDSWWRFGGRYDFYIPLAMALVMW